MMLRFLKIFCAIMLLASCSGKEQQGDFIRQADSREGIYVFDVDMQDAGASYDFSFFSRTSGRTMQNVRLKVRWLTPSGESMAETVYFRTVTAKGSRELYRSGMVPSEPGIWKLSVLPEDPDGNLLGWGLLTRKENGTR